MTIGHRLVIFGIGQSLLLLLLTTTSINSSSTQEDPQVVKDTLMEQLSLDFSWDCQYLSNLMLDRFEYCDASFAGQPFKTKVDEILDIFQKSMKEMCELPEGASTDHEQDYRKESKLDLEYIKERGLIPDEKVAKQYIKYWRLYELDCDMVNGFRKDMKDQFGKRDLSKDVQLLKIFKQHFYIFLWTLNYEWQGKLLNAFEGPV